VPGSGKTTALLAFAERYGYTYISSDDIRAEMTSSAADQSQNTLVWDTVRERLANALAREETVVVDATFTNQQERQDFIAFARERGATKVFGLFAALPFDIAYERNASRERVVPDHAMVRMQRQLVANPPVVEDGFDAVFDIDEIQELTRAERIGINGRPWGKVFKTN